MKRIYKKITVVEEAWDCHDRLPVFRSLAVFCLYEITKFNKVIQLAEQQLYWDGRKYRNNPCRLTRKLIHEPSNDPIKIKISAVTPSLETFGHRDTGPERRIH